MIQKMIDAQYRRPSGLLGRWIGQQMAQQHVPENEWTVDLLDVQPDDHVLEIGFGPGIAIQHLVPRMRGGLIAGVDYSNSMVSTARKRNARAVKAGLVDLHYGDVVRLPFDDAAFDKVFSIHSIYFWPDPMRALREIHRVMKPGGRLILTILPLESPEEAEGTPEFRPYSGRQLETMLSQTGFHQPQSVRDEKKLSPSNFSVVATR